MILDKVKNGYFCYMKLKYIVPIKQEPIYKASVHKTARIGFTIETANNFKISVDKSMILAVNSEDETDGSIYGILTEAKDPNGYKIQKAGKYHSVNAKGFFDTLAIIYKDGDISFIVTESEIDEIKVIKFTPKEPFQKGLPF